MSWYFLLKVVLSGAIIALVSEATRRSGPLAAVLASLPLTSLLALCWVYHEQGGASIGAEKAAALALDIFWAVLPSLVFFLVLPLLVRKGLTFYPSLFLACIGTALAYWLYLRLLA
ncbi:MAG: hypothetical protein A2284_09655 [Deltaproteobacteria bacterium RIFOXYA12_FULL_61_11]|nr:MAG: hypothetical protein A2284_09655 [Deltaproteobacteria bacterium RIFOXYA12_FULL_61_11]